jgi:hypothetical protein
MANRDRMLRFIERLVRAGHLDWARRARTRYTMINIGRHRLMRDELQPLPFLPLSDLVPVRSTPVPHL